MNRSCVALLILCFCIGSFIQSHAQEFKETSVFASGDIYKIKVSKTGIHKIDFNFISGLDVSSATASNIHIYGQGGGIVPRLNSANRVDDIAELKIKSVGLQDGNWDSGDYILFYAEAAETWKTDGSSIDFHNNPYCGDNFYYIKFEGSGQSQMQEAESKVALQNFKSYHDYQRYEENMVNLLGESTGHIASGQVWFGDQFKNTRQRSYTGQFDFNNAIVGSDVAFTFSAAARSSSSSTMEINFGNQTTSNVFPSTNVTNIDSPYARLQTPRMQFQFEANPSIDLNYLPNGDSESSLWLDYIDIVLEKEINYTSGEMYISNNGMKDYESVSFTIASNQSSVDVWDVSEHLDTRELRVESIGNQHTFTSANDSLLRRFVCFQESAVNLKPELVGQIENQNLHGIEAADMVIIYHNKFKTAVERIAEHRRLHNGYNVVLVDVDLIWNEFSSGRVDPAGIRDMTRMIHERDESFKFVLLVGDGTYDYKNIKGQSEDLNYIPVHETIESLRPIYAYPTDDFYTLLDANEGVEGNTGLGGDVDLAIGRLPVNTTEQADGVVNKIIHYETSSACYGPWRTDFTFCADDGNGTLHVSDCNSIAVDMEEEHPKYVYDKVYFDAYKQISTPGGERYPEASEDIVNNVQSGQLVTCYLGHGGPKGWAQERVLQASHINAWDNLDAMTVMITATCSFAGYDDPEIISAGEQVILNAKGGVVGLLTTVRSVFTNANKALTKASWEELFSEVSSGNNSIGEGLMRAKNSIVGGSNIENTRKYTLLGDPAMQLAIPKNNIRLTTLNGIPTNSSSIDTLSSLERVVIEGQVENNGVLLEDFNGELFIRLFDKENSIQTLQNDAESGLYTFGLRNTILFKGKASVNNGKFATEFIIPKDINFDFGEGKFVFYATDWSRDAAGYYDEMIIGGSIDGSIVDNEGPEIELYMGDYNFANGGRTDENPILIAELTDENGINVSNTSIGHDLKATLDDDTQQSYIVSEYYTAELDDYTRGEVRYPFRGLTEGKHTVEFVAWDILNNSSTKTLDFIVSKGDIESLTNVFNYPNPFSSITNFSFEHGGADGDIDIFINIFNSSGKIVTTLQYNRLSSGFREVDMEWRGSDRLGSKMPAGIYHYQIQLNELATNTTRTSDFKKLVIIY